MLRGIEAGGRGPIILYSALARPIYLTAYRRRIWIMTTIQIELPDTTATAALRAGLLTPQALDQAPPSCGYPAIDRGARRSHRDRADADGRDQRRGEGITRRTAAACERSLIPMC